ncbi:hypothetical protein N2152v2_010066 [Parachlorella kessleri]
MQDAGAVHLSSKSCKIDSRSGAHSTVSSQPVSIALTAAVESPLTEAANAGNPSWSGNPSKIAELSSLTTQSGYHTPPAATETYSAGADAALDTPTEPEAAATHDSARAGPQPYTLLEKVALAGGTLDLVHIEKERLLRVWLPPGYSREEASRHPYPLLLLNDGQNLFDDALSFSGSSWRAADTAAELITSGQLPPFVVVGVDHAGPLRSLEYLPYTPGTGPGNFRLDAALWPGGAVAAYMDRILNEILPWLEDTYGVSTAAQHIAFGGSSFGGVCALWASMNHPDRIGAALVESPSLWIADEKFLREDLPQYRGPWPQRIFLAMGSKEYSGIRQDPGPQWDRLLVGYCEELAELLTAKGLGSDRLQWQVDEGATHTESAWAQRLPAALTHLLSPWWHAVLCRHAGSLYFTSPRKLEAGQPAVLFVDTSRSHVFAQRAQHLQVKLGFNNWTLGCQQLQLRPAPQLGRAQRAQHQAQHAALAQQGQHASHNNQQGQQGGGGSSGSGSSSWQAVSFVVPHDAYEMHFALTDGQEWDNNAGSDFYIRVKLAYSTAAGQQPSLDAVLATAQAAAEGPVVEAASRNASKLYFTAPEVPAAGAPARLYFNRARSWALAHNPNVKVHLGFNHWEEGARDMQLAPTELWRGEGIDWWRTPAFQVPDQAFDLSFAFTDGHGAWDNNDGHNYSLPVWQPQQQQRKQEARLRSIASVEVVDHAGGKLHIVELARREGGDKSSREAKWKEERVLRVWTPPGYSQDSPPPGGWPVLWMNDGKNMYEDWLAHQGHAWNVGHCAAGLIARGEVPPFVIVAVDSAGPMRSLNYLPYKPGTGVGGFRGDAERWPGGGCEGYMRRLVQELMPLVSDTFATATDPARVAFGGGSFAGITALYAAMHYPHVFGSVLAESPSLWIAEGQFLRDLWDYRGPLPERLFMGCGTKEYSATRDHVRDDVDALLLHYYQEAARALEGAGLRGPKRLRFLVEEEAGHHELAWSWRLTGALSFLLAPWWDA